MAQGNPLPILVEEQELSDEQILQCVYRIVRESDDVELMKRIEGVLGLKGEKFQGGSKILCNEKYFFMYGYPMAQLTVDIVYHSTTDDCIMLILRDREPHIGCVAITGGFVDIINGESPLEAAKREGKEEVNMIGEPELVTTVGNATRDPRGYTHTCVYYMECSDFKKARAGDDARGLIFVHRYDLANYLTSLDYDGFPAVKQSAHCSADQREDIFIPRGNFAFDHEMILHEVFMKKNFMHP